MFLMNNVLVVVSVGILYFLAHAFAGIYRRTKIPDVLLLMIVGLVLGPLLGIVTPKQLEQVGSILNNYSQKRRVLKNVSPR